MPEEWVVPRNTAVRFFDIFMRTLDRWINRGAPVHARDEKGRVRLLHLPDLVMWRMSPEDLSSLHLRDCVA
jgi:phage terminase Nu1 subunit (DNA packaging protein)